jgi:hypothetical protein
MTIDGCKTGSSDGAKILFEWNVYVHIGIPKLVLPEARSAQWAKPPRPLAIFGARGSELGHPNTAKPMLKAAHERLEPIEPSKNGNFLSLPRHQWFLLNQAIWPLPLFSATIPGL